MATIPLSTIPLSADKIQDAINTLTNNVNAFLTGMSPEQVTITGGTIDGTSIGATNPSTGAFTTLTGTSGSINGDTIATLTAAQTLTNKILTSPVVTGGSINNTPIGSITRNTGSFTTLLSSSILSSTATNSGIVYTDASGNLSIDTANICWDITNKRLGIAQAGTAPSAKIDIHATDLTVPVAQFNQLSSTNGATGGAIVQTIADPGAAMANGARLGVVQFAGATDAAHTTVTGAAINATTTQAWNGTSAGTALNFLVTANGSTTRSTALTLSQDLSATFAGSITGGTWAAGVIAGQYGGTGVANTGKTLTLGGNFTTSGAFTTTLTATANTAITMPTTGTLATLANTETLTNKTITDFINSSAKFGFVGSVISNTTLADVSGMSVNLTAGATYIFTVTGFGTSNVAGGFKIGLGGTATQTSARTVSYIDNSGAFVGNFSTGTATGTVVSLTATTQWSFFTYGYVTVNAAGTFTVQFAQNVSNASASALLFATLNMNRVS